MAISWLDFVSASFSSGAGSQKRSILQLARLKWPRSACPIQVFSASHDWLPDLRRPDGTLGVLGPAGSAGLAHLHRNRDTTGAQIARTDRRETPATGDDHLRASGNRGRLSI